LAINHVVLTGRVAAPGPKLTYNAAAKPEAKLTLIVSDGKGEQVFHLYVPVFIYGAGAERAAEDVDVGDSVAIEGRLGWKSTLKKDGSKLGLCVTTFGVEVLVKAGVSNESAPALTAEPEPTSELPAEQKKGRPRYPRWKPDSAGSVN
jgi:single-stranded DNA-binding protein